MNIVCETCRASFMNTTKAPALTEHAQNKHSKSLADCFRKSTLYMLKTSTCVFYSHFERSNF